MKKIPLTNFLGDKNSTLNVFTSNNFYDQFVFQKEYFPYQFDYWKEKKFYGIMFKNIVYEPKISSLKTIKNNNGNSFNVLAFVADAFEEFKSYYSKFVFDGKTSNQSSIYDSLNINTAHTNLNEVYVSYMNDLFKIFDTKYLNENSKKQITSFDIFIKYLLSFIKVISSETSFSRSNFAINKLCPPEVSGLMINFDVPRGFSNAVKKQNYIDSDGFDLFFESAKRFGFLVDRNAPWRLVADINSPVMIEFYKKYGVYNLEQMFDFFYHKSYTGDIETNKNMIIAFWNKYVSKNSLVENNSEISNCKDLFHSSLTLKQLTVDNFNINYPIEWQLRFDLYVKILEKRINITQSAFDNIYNECIQLNKYYNLQTALEYLNNKMVQLSDKQSTNILTTNVNSDNVVVNDNLNISEKIVF